MKNAENKHNCSYAYRNQLELRQHLEPRQKVLHENQRNLSKSQKLQQRRLEPFTVTKRVTNTTYQIQDDKDPMVLQTVLRNHLVEDYRKEETLPPMNKEFVPVNRRHKNFYENFMEQRIRKPNNPKPPGMHEPLPFQRQPLRTASTVIRPKRVSNTSSDSGNHSPHVLSPVMPITPRNQHSPVPTTSRLDNLPRSPNQL